MIITDILTQDNEKVLMIALDEQNLKDLCTNRALYVSVQGFRVLVTRKENMSEINEWLDYGKAKTTEVLWSPTS